MNVEFYRSNDDMVVGVLSVRLIIRGACTLKDKRRVVKGLKDRIGNTFNVSISEVGTLDHCQYAKLGITMVGNDDKYVNGALSNLINMLRSAVAAELVDYHLEFVYPGQTKVHTSEAAHRKGDEDKNNDFQMKGNYCVNKKNRETV